MIRLVLNVPGDDIKCPRGPGTLPLSFFVPYTYQNEIKLSFLFLEKVSSEIIKGLAVISLVLINMLESS